MTATPYRLAHIHGDRWRVMKGKRLVVRSESLKRAQEIMEVQQEISLEKNMDKVGKSFKVLIDKK